MNHPALLALLALLASCSPKPTKPNSTTSATKPAEAAQPAASEAAMPGDELSAEDLDAEAEHLAKQDAQERISADTRAALRDTCDEPDMPRRVQEAAQRLTEEHHPITSEQLAVQVAAVVQAARNLSAPDVHPTSCAPTLPSIVEGWRDDPRTLKY